MYVVMRIETAGIEVFNPKNQVPVMCTVHSKDIMYVYG
jgi:hypothetical protein